MICVLNVIRANEEIKAIFETALSGMQKRSDDL